MSRLSSMAPLVHRGPSHAAGPQRCGPGPWIFPLENKSGKSIFLTILQLSP
jgi:hypothetical protein